MIYPNLNRAMKNESVTKTDIANLLGIHFNTVTAKLEGETTSEKNMYQIGFEDYIRYKMFEDKPDLIYNIIKDICTTCCQENSWYQTSETFTGKNGKKTTYKNPKMDDESIQKELTKRFEKFYK